MVAGTRHTHRRPAARAVAPLVAAAVFLVFSAAAPAPEIIRLEAEDFVAADTASGPYLAVVSDSHASGNLAVAGFDTPGTWLEYELVLAAPFRFKTSVRSAGGVGLVRTFEILFTPAGAPQPAAADTVVTPPGSGVG